jgi:hypothetical protein
MNKITTDRDRDRNERGQKERNGNGEDWQSWNDASHQGESISQGIFPR